MSYSNDRPRLTANAEISVLEGGEVAITSDILQVSDDSLPAEIVYRVLALPEEGFLNLNGNQLTLGSTFTQADINSGRLTYLHNSSDMVRDRFSFSVSEHSGGLISRVSVASGNAQSEGGGQYVTHISADGRYVLFDSFADNLVDGDTNKANWATAILSIRRFLRMDATLPLPRMRITWSQEIPITRPMCFSTIAKPER